MKCREFEDNLERYFKECEFQKCANATATDDWSHFSPSNEYHELILKHVASCDDCKTSLLWYLDIKDSVDYRKFPCLHVAYFSNHAEDRCLDYFHGLFSVILDREKRSGIVIGFCPWCGIELNTSAI